MKLPWLVLPVIVGGGAAAANVDRAAGIAAVSDKVSTGYEAKVLLGKGIAYQQEKRARPRDGGSIQSASANDVRVDLDALNVALPNQTKPKLNIPRGSSQPDTQMDSIPIVKLRASNSAPPESQQPPEGEADPPITGHDPDVEEASASSSDGAETRNPASANRAIAGMSAGLVSVMLIFTVFL